MAIQKVSSETREAIARKSARSLPTRPSAAGMKPDEIKKAFYEPIVGAAVSALGEIDRVVDEANSALEEEHQGRVDHEERQDNPHAVTAAQVGLGAVDNTADCDKPVSVAQQAAISGRVVRVGTQEPALYLTDGMDGVGRGTVPVAEDARGGAVALRDALGAMFVGAAAEGGHAVNLSVLRAVVETLVAKVGDQAIDGDLSISGNLYVAGKTHGIEAETLRVKDAVIVANADGEVLAELAGYVIRVGGERAYGIMYNPAEDCVKIGLGRLEGQLFIYDEGEAQVLATRGEIANGSIPMWDGERHQFVDGMIPAVEVANKAFVRKYFSDVYDKGYEDGYAAAEGSYGNALRGVVSGDGAVRITDVSPLPHPIKVTCGGEKVVRYGKNLLDDSEAALGEVEKTTAQTGKKRYGFSVKLSAGTYTAHAEGDPSAFNNNDYIYGILFGANGERKRGVNCVIGSRIDPITFDAEDGDVLEIYNAGTGNEEIAQSKEILFHYHYQVEVGGAATAYQPYAEPLEVAVVDGVAEVPSLSPTTIILGEGAIEAQYNRDINQAYTKLVNAILALGGAMNV